MSKIILETAMGYLLLEDDLLLLETGFYLLLENGDKLIL